ncbi:MAG: DUF4251 domain-containing protein [Maribacter sp.]|nr:DUF4251 domain-containing protein [Maribacter sp.]
MKKLKILILLVFCIHVLAAQTRKEKATKAYETTKALVTSGNFMFDADRANPVSGSSISMTTNANYLKIMKDSVSAYLPYFGTVTSSLGYSGEGAIQFDTHPANYKAQFNDAKRNITVEFSAFGKSELFDVILEISGSQYANLLVNTMSRSSIRYYGKISTLDTYRTAQ